MSIEMVEKYDVMQEEKEKLLKQLKNTLKYDKFDLARRKSVADKG